ncbi:MAG TPA: hypothetical protein VNL94_00660 [Candidatus Binatia bacterium]|nr:hypothetical protein [Candidatus Binatia bacterium]
MSVPTDAGPPPPPDSPPGSNWHGTTLPAPGPSFLREQELVVRGRRLRAGMSRPSSHAEDWWTAVLWVADEHDRLASFADLAPAAGPPPEPPAARLGPAVAGGLSGLILEDAGRLQVRLGPVVPPESPDRPWRAPAIVRAAFRWEPARAATMRPNELAAEVLTSFRQAVEGLGRR